MMSLMWKRFLMDLRKIGKSTNLRTSIRASQKKQAFSAEFAEYAGFAERKHAFLCALSLSRSQLGWASCPRSSEVR
jgi:hypothetical protein